MVGCEFTVKFANTGYSAAEPVINWLSQSAYQINRLEANDSKIMFNLASAILQILAWKGLNVDPINYLR